MNAMTVWSGGKAGNGAASRLNEGCVVFRPANQSAECARGIGLVRTIITLILAPWLLAACATTTGPVVALPNGYYLQPNKKQQTEIVKRGGRQVLRGPIAAYAVSAEIVTGALGEPRLESRSYPNDLPFKGTAETRYFVLETVSGRLDSNLDESAWRSRLADLGAPASLRIYAPLPWQVALAPTRPAH
jgi:hypothetical protein